MVGGCTKTGMSEGGVNHDREGFCPARKSYERNLTKEFETGGFERRCLEDNSTIYQIKLEGR